MTIRLIKLASSPHVLVLYIARWHRWSLRYYLPLLGLRFLTDERTEWIFVGTSIVIGVASLLPSYLRHRRTRPIALFALGLCLILTARLILEGNLAVELPILILGALFVSLSHLINRKLCQS